MGTPVPDPYDLTDTARLEAQRVALDLLLFADDLGKSGPVEEAAVARMRELVGTLDDEERGTVLLVLVSLADTIGHLGGRCPASQLLRLRAHVEAGSLLGGPDRG